MQGFDGFSVVQGLMEVEPPLFVFVTAYSDHAIRAFEAQAMDYLMKPVEPARLQRALERAREYLEHRRSQAAPKPAPKSKWIEEFWASDLSGLVRIAARDIDRVSAERDYMRLHVGRRSWLIHHSMTALEEGLDSDLFVRLHRSAIVRKDFIAGFSRNASGRWIARLADGTEQPVGRLYSDRVREIAVR
jgi:two-component system response regulator AlgR